MSYFEAVETNYLDAIQEGRKREEKLKKEVHKHKSKNINDKIYKSDLEHLFVDCVEDVRRNIIKRRLKSEIIGKK